MNRIARSLFPLLILSLLVLVQPVAAQDPAPETVSGQVKGVVENLTPDAKAPTEIPVYLYVLENFEPVEVLTGTVESDGTFSFQDLLLVEGMTYIATLDYSGVSYGSRFITFDGVGEEIQVKIETYEPTNDTSFITVSRMHIIVDFSGENMRVSELYVFNNLSDWVFVGPTSDPADGTLELPLPAGALNPLVERGMGESMVPTTNSILSVEGGYLDTLPVRPGVGSQQLMVTYELPYGQEATVSHPLPYPVQDVSLFVPDAGLVIESDLLTGRGPQSMGGRMMVQWDAADLAAGETLSFRISGEPDLSSVIVESEMPGPVMPGSPNPHLEQATTSPLFVSAGDNPTTWAIGVGGLLIAVGLVAFFWTQRLDAPERAPQEQLLQAIVDLDAAHAAGEISTGRYEWGREQLKDELRGWYSDQSGEQRERDQSGECNQATA
jgi:hypothetical protein